MARHIFVTGGTGYIGSHMVRLLRSQGDVVTIFDNLSTGHEDTVPENMLIRADLRDAAAIAKALAGARFDAVIHFAACCYVGESMVEPEKYFSNNIVGTANLLAAMRAADTRRLVFSSSCATYGAPRYTPIDETHPQEPVNPYGYSKLVSERLMAEYARAYGFDVIALRYFNAGGCALDGSLGERHDPETHLIPLVLREATRIAGGGEPDATALRIFGTDFDTADGTCVRDYIHVEDLCEAHALALSRMDARGGTGHFEAFNLGTGTGYSVKQVIETCREVTRQPIASRDAPRRPGDPAHLVASAELARRELGWQPRIAAVRDIVASAWRWQNK
jgi:UDP-glucose 4-epimerase